MIFQNVRETEVFVHSVSITTTVSTMASHDVEAPFIPDFCAFDDKAIRRGFIRKVFLILAAQLLVLTGEWNTSSVYDILLVRNGAHSIFC